MHALLSYQPGTRSIRYPRLADTVFVAPRAVASAIVLILLYLAVVTPLRCSFR
jgi:hypothetical protein